MQINTENIPSQLKTFPNFVLWKEEDRDGKKTKVPYQTNGCHAKPNDSMTWTNFSAAVSAYQSESGKYDGIGFCLSEGTPIGVDLDHCRCPAFDSINVEIIAPWAKDIINKIDSYTEASPSGKGIRIFAYGGNLPERGRNKKLPQHGGDNCQKGSVPAFEIYQSGRYLTVTGNHIAGTPTDIMSRPGIIDDVYNQIFGNGFKDDNKPEKLHHASNVSITNILEKAYRSNSGDKIKHLYNGDYSAYPSQSEADLALCYHLAFWFDGDAVAIDAAFRESRLFRNKWDIKHHGNGQTYGQGTIEKAIQGCHSFFKDSLQKIYGEESEQGAPPSMAWPEPLDDAAYHGLAGEFVKKIAPNTEADPAALLFQFLVAFGNIVGRNPYFMVEATAHRCNENLLLVGNTSKARKGTAWDHVRNIAGLVDYDWTAKCIKSGLTSGEGLIYHVRDGAIQDKRLVVYEPEFAAILKIIERKDNTLSTTIREAWDRGDLRTLAKNSPVTATGTHISIVSHITKEELRTRLSDTELFNGFANRFLFACVQRSNILPEGGTAVDLSDIVSRISKALEFSQAVGEMQRDEDARAIWFGVYEKLTREQPGILGSVLARDAAHVVRLSMIYALLDCSTLIKREHLMAALACWEYVEASARFIFDSMTGDPMADRIYEAAWAAGDAGITRTFINNTLFRRNLTATRIEKAIKALLDMNKIKIESINTGGRPEVRIYLPQMRQ